MAMQIFDGVLRVVPDAPVRHVVLRFGVPDVHSRLRDDVLRGKFGPEAEIIFCGNIESPGHVLALLAEYGGTVVDWVPSASRWETAKPLLGELKEMGIPVLVPLFVDGGFDGYIEWPKERDL